VVTDPETGVMAFAIVCLGVLVVFAPLEWSLVRPAVRLSTRFA
jgi:hypothetical protein